MKYVEEFKKYFLNNMEDFEASNIYTKQNVKYYWYFI